MILAIMSDTHLSAEHYRKVDKETGLNRFYVRQFETLEWISSFLKDKGITTIIHAGDMFDSASPSVHSILKARKILKDFDVYAIKGNHDDNSFLHNNRLSALDLLEVTNFAEPGSKIIGNLNFVFTPWGYDVPLDLIKKDMKNVLVIHKFPKPYFSEDVDNVLDRDIAKNFDLVITGHYHIAETFADEGTVFLNPGSISAFANKPSNDKSSIWLLNTENMMIKRIVLPTAIKLFKERLNDPDEYLESIDSEDLFSITTPTIPSPDVLQKARLVALDIKLTIEQKEKEEGDVKVEEIEEFWEYVKKHTEYEQEFRKIIQSSEE